MSALVILAAAAGIKIGFAITYYRLHCNAREHHKEGCSRACYAWLFWLSLALAGVALAEAAYELSRFPLFHHEIGSASPPSPGPGRR